jgi:hypothetical protein
MRLRTGSLGGLVAALLFLGPGLVQDASAAAFTVSGPGDNTNACTNTTCPSLRSAVLASNAVGGTNTISVPAGQYTLTRTPTGTDDGRSGDLHITSNVTITGAGAKPGGTTITGDGDRIFDISANAVTLSGLTLTGGSGEDFGGAINDTGASLTLTQDALTTNTTNPDGGFGGALYMAPTVPATLIVKSSFFKSNTAAESGTGGGGFGGAISFEPNGTGQMTVSNSEFDSNTAQSGSTSGGGFGGGIDFETGGAGTLTLTGSTFSANVAAGSTGQGGFGGAIEFEPGNSSTLTLTNSTLTGNQAGGHSSFGGALDWEPGSGSSGTLTQATVVGNSASTSSQGGGLLIQGAPVTIRNSIVSGNTGGAAVSNCSVDFDADLIPQGHNIELGSTCGFDLDVDPLLSPLAHNGGPTQTMALASDSPARDAADPNFCPQTDQRGLTRPDDPGTPCDIGAFEFAVRVPVNTSRPVITGKPVIGRTVTCTNGRWTNDPTKFSYQWKRGGRAIRGATRRMLKVPALDRDDRVTGRADGDDLLTCTVVASNADGPGKPATSAHVTPRRGP